jgi:hypothetical protein
MDFQFFEIQFFEKTMKNNEKPYENHEKTMKNQEKTMKHHGSHGRGTLVSPRDPMGGDPWEPKGIPPMGGEPLGAQGNPWEGTHGSPGTTEGGSVSLKPAGVSKDHFGGVLC